MTGTSCQARRVAGCLLALAAAALLLAALATPADAQLRRGIDVSRFNGTIDWPRIPTDRISFAYVQASRGDGRHCPVVPERCGADEHYETNYRGARAAGLRVGAYHRAFTRFRQLDPAKRHARREANVFINRVGRLRPRDLRPALDVETPFGQTRPNVLRSWIRVWLRRVERQLGAKPIIYTNSSSWQATGDATGFARRGHLLWVAHWKVPSPLVPARNWLEEGWEIWQHRSDGRVRGIRGPVDVNRLPGGFGRLTVGPIRGEPAPDPPPEV